MMDLRQDKNLTWLFTVIGARESYLATLCNGMNTKHVRLLRGLKGPEGAMLTQHVAGLLSNVFVLKMDSRSKVAFDVFAAYLFLEIEFEACYFLHSQGKHLPSSYISLL